MVAVVIGSALVGAAGVGAAALLKSPAQVAAETAPPAPDTLTAEVEQRVIADTLVTRGKVTAASAAEISVPASAGAPGTRPVVTKVKVQAGDQLSYGKVLFEISGRPVFSLPGALPAYRDLQTGSKGEDVAQLQKALASLKYRTAPDIAGTFGAGTERAVVAFYKSIGYSPVRTSAGVPEDKPGGVRTVPPATSDKGGDTKTPSTGTPASTSEPQTVVTVPMSEVVFLGALPVRVDTVSAAVGKAPADKMLTVSAGSPVVVAEVSAQEKSLLKEGQPVDILSEDSGLKVPGVVQAVVDAPPTTKGDQQGPAVGYLLRVMPSSPLPAELAGKEVRISITASSTDGAVLAVPSAAISAGADGQTSVTVLGADGHLRRVQVRPGASGGGFVAVTPGAGAVLTPGDKVVVGSTP
ncbi:peptidoglycan-binding domain-containing protein [Kitasatospora purpeofusca]|uniref:peptidoglycan-binding domain-containing protein n=1 Tax=Kitasatospora purpeofusca TaxID=67352 RepID=UPI00224F53B4|nr:peptidoglycan-binding domain-containing protein [Kitasatospora purpeofusca]MCX4754308.1 peptidoglycan-binding protein [Kitasatospora purpeofusca]WSR33736.1 peptidoglycan-binding protein [Kitasatospora purpeofusca]WSR41443.1 peptidoglycan-binding protein [Kitasatospora purpeofusca]